jgi:hypothetical protein
MEKSTSFLFTTKLFHTAINKTAIFIPNSFLLAKLFDPSLTNPYHAAHSMSAIPVPH